MTTATLVASGKFPGLSTECVQDWHGECTYVRCGCDCHIVARLSDRQAAILRAVTEHIRENGYAPSLRELAGLVGLRSADTVVYHLRRLVGLGLLVQGAGKARALGLPPHRHPADFPPGR